MKEQYRCGSCLHFRQHAHPSQGSVCSLLGVKHYNVAPRCYTPDVSQLAESNEDLANLAIMFAALTHKQKAIFRAILDTNTSKRVHPIGQLLYFKAAGRDYISNYLSGYVMGYTSTKQLILAGSPDARQRGRLYLAYLEPTEETLYTPTAWLKKKSELVRAGRIADPKGMLVMPKGDIDNYEPPTLDKAPKECLDELDTKAQKAAKRKAKDAKEEITISIVK